MFKSIRWKFTTIYFLLVFIAMLIVGVFIIKQFEKLQIDQTTKTMSGYVDRLANTSPAIKSEKWEENIDQNTFNNWPLPINYRIYIIENGEYPKIVGTNPWDNSLIGKNVFEFKEIYSPYILEALNNKQMGDIPPVTQKESSRENHFTYPVSNEDGEVIGIIYVACELTDIDDMLNKSKLIFIRGTIIALLITIFLGFLIAKSVTVPINDVTIKAKQMAKGNFDQRVDVKSNDEIGQLAMMFNTLTAKLKNTLAEIYREKSKMDTIFNYMADGIIACDIDGNILHANPIALDILKTSFDALIDVDYDYTISTLDNKLTLEYMKKNNSWKGNELINIGNSSYLAKYAPFKSDNEEIGGVIVVFQDVTEQQKLEKMRREFVANVSHELKTPITTIKSYTETIIDGAIDEKELSLRFLDIVNSECDRMTRIVRDLLQLSNMDYKHIKWKFMNISVKSLLDTAIMKLKIAAEEKQQTINLSIEQNIPNIYADKDGIEQVVLNILSNAIKYTPKQGEISIKAFQNMNNIYITIKDNGIGIPKEDLNRIFERFYRVDKARSREMGGTGLGLAIAKQIIQAHKGTIEIDSEYNKGTEVKIILLVEENTAQ
ncbi:ATP-binding protein [Abyssisolibacter fermentans]|uniref:ATP-binding protein n=1 Tax=Abyssisolibacter fermentans TaxID=1766203 RepID=UPI00082D1567|nr:ATP-binding protein [Abyssisolibacter fermentans]